MGKNIYLTDAERFLLLNLLDEPPTCHEWLGQEIARIYHDDRPIGEMKKTIMRKMED